MNIELIENLYMHMLYLSWTTDMWFECAGNNQDYTFVSIEIAKVRSNEVILTSLLSILLCECNVNGCFKLDSFFVKIDLPLIMLNVYFIVSLDTYVIMCLNGKSS